MFYIDLVPMLAIMGNRESRPSKNMSSLAEADFALSSIGRSQLSARLNLFE